MMSSEWMNHPGIEDPSNPKPLIKPEVISVPIDLQIAKKSDTTNENFYKAKIKGTIIFAADLLKKPLPKAVYRAVKDKRIF